VPAPLQHVHAQPRRVGQLQEEELVAGQVADSGRVHRHRTGQGQDVEAVQAQAEVGVVSRRDDPPRVEVVADVPAPGQRLVGDADAVAGRQGGELVQLRGGERVVIDGRRRHVGADQQQVGAERSHELELALRPAQVAREQLCWDRLEVAERLVHLDAEPEVGSPAPDLGGGGGAVDEVVLEDLHPVEAHLGGGGELLFQRAAQRDGGDGLAHART